MAIVAVAAVMSVGFRPSDKYFEIAKNLDIFATLFQEVNRAYVDDISPGDLIKSGIDGMLATLDPYTNYIPEDEIEDYRTMTTGEYGGIGADIIRRDDRVVVTMPYEGFGAQRAGMRIGDEILKVNDIDISPATINDLGRLFKGQSKTTLTVIVKRFGEAQPVTLQVERESIQLKNVPYYGMVTDDIGIIHLKDFTRNASKEVRDALADLKTKGAKKIILDVRGNPGGLLQEAINISNIFLPKGKLIVSTKGRMASWNKTYEAPVQPADTDIPMVVLTSNHSASAAEIVAGVIQDYDRGVLIGKRTFGKGLVQTTLQLSYNSKLKVTVAKYYIPSGRCIQEIDYSSRDEEGEALKVPDSLKTAHKTINGRTVYGGGGIEPDIETPKETYSPIAQGLVQKYMIFDYATIYHHRHPQITDPRSFRLSDKEYDEFVAWLNKQDFSYSGRSVEQLQKLVSSTKNEKLYEGLKADLAELERKLQPNRQEDLVKFKAEIKSILEADIASRYYLQRGAIEASFDEDGDVKAAIELLKDMPRYQKVLTAQP